MNDLPQGLVRVRFLKYVPPYNTGEIAAVGYERAAALQEFGLAEPVDPQPVSDTDSIEEQVKKDSAREPGGRRKPRKG